MAGLAQGPHHARRVGGPPPVGSGREGVHRQRKCARNPYLFIFLNTFKYVSAHETITLINASIILKKEEYEYSTFPCRPYSLFCGILPSCFCSPRNAGESK
ncbi:conserved hypothetical protein, partial [Streptomyces viridosporus ATCC 14672]